MQYDIDVFHVCEGVMLSLVVLFPGTIKLGQMMRHPVSPNNAALTKRNDGFLGIILAIGGFVLLIIIAALWRPFWTPTPMTVMTEVSNTPATPSKTATPRPTQTPEAVRLHACVTDSVIRVRRGPGTDYEMIDGMVAGTCMSVLGRNQDSSWVYMVSDDNKTGWVAAWLLTIEGDLSRVAVRSGADVVPTAARGPVVLATNTSQLPHRFESPSHCSDLTSSIGETVSCRIEHAECVYGADVDGNATFCNDRPYPNQNFQLVVFGEDWSDLDGSCIIVAGYLKTHRGVLQIQAFSRSQVSYCE